LTAELPPVIRPLSLEPRTALTGKKLGDHFRLFLIDAAAIGATGFDQKSVSGISAPNFASAARDTTTISFIANAHRSGFPSAPAGNSGHRGLPVA
jgi:hypothetical protein